MKKRFGFLPLVLTSLFGVAGILAVGFVFYAIEPDTVWEGVLISVLFFTIPMLLGFTGLRLALRLERKKYQVKEDRGCFVRLVVVLILVGLLGGVGQLLYCLEWQTYTVDTEVDMPSKGNHVVMLMDISGSMRDERDACIEAACQLIDGLDETTAMQFIAFAATVEPRNESAFLPLTADNKLVLQDLIRAIDMEGKTNFNQPLETAIHTLQTHQAPDYRSMILMITDGKDDINSSIKRTLSDPGSGIELFTLRITEGSGAPDAQVQALIDLAKQDYPIQQKADGTVDMTTVLDNLRSAIDSQKTITEEHRKLAFGNDLVFSIGSANFWWRSVIQVVLFGLYSVLISVAYYGKPGVLSLLLSAAGGLFTGFMLCMDMEFYPALLIILCLGAFTVYEIEEAKPNV